MSITKKQIRNALDGLNTEFRSPRGDDLTSFVAQDLEQTLAQAFDIEYGLQRAGQFVSFDTSLGEYAESWARIYWDQTGQAKIGSTMQGDAPRVDVVKTKETHGTAIITASYGWNVMELQRAAATGTPLSTLKQNAAVEAINRKIDEIATSGDASLGFTGLVNDANVTLSNPPPVGAWSGLTGQQLVDSMLGMELLANNATLDRRPPDTLLLPPTAFQRVHATYSANDGVTVLAKFLQSARWINRVEQWQELETAGTASAPRAVVYNSGATTVNMKIGKLPGFLPPQARGFEFIVPAYAVVGGVEFARPGAATYYEGV